jgi:mRNA-degrading endonuclease RelE of RelBE toxin-antitoxin system
MARFGVSNYTDVYEAQFVENLRLYSAVRKQIVRRVERGLANPYENTEFPGDISGKLNLHGCRSSRVDRNFRIIYVICEECRRIQDCQFCFCDDLDDKTVVFLTVRPHDRAYAMK